MFHGSGHKTQVAIFIIFLIYALFVGICRFLLQKQPQLFTLAVDLTIVIPVF